MAHRRNWIALALAAVSLLLLLGAMILCGITVRLPIIRSWSTGPNRIHGINLSEGRIALVSIDLDQSEPEPLPSVDVIMSWRKYREHQHILALFGFNFYSVTPAPNSILSDQGVNSFWMVSLPDWIFMLAAALFPAALAWVTLDRQTRTANAEAASAVFARADVPDAAAASSQLEYFRAEPKPSASIRYAGIGRRLLAFIVDYLICMCILCAVFFVATGDVSAPPGANAATDVIATELTLLGVCWLYWALFEASSLQATPGKRMFAMRVTDAAGQRITFTRATARFFAKIPSNIPLGIGLVFPLFTFRKQALHDIMAGTLVVRR